LNIDVNIPVFENKLPIFQQQSTKNSRGISAGITQKHTKLTLISPTAAIRPIRALRQCNFTGTIIPALAPDTDRAVQSSLKDFENIDDRDGPDLSARMSEKRGVLFCAKNDMSLASLRENLSFNKKPRAYNFSAAAPTGLHLEKLRYSITPPVDAKSVMSASKPLRRAFTAPIHHVPCIFIRSDPKERVNLADDTSCKTRMDYLAIFLHGNGEDLYEAYYFCKLLRCGFNVVYPLTLVQCTRGGISWIRHVFWEGAY